MSLRSLWKTKPHQKKPWALALLSDGQSVVNGIF